MTFRQIFQIFQTLSTLQIPQISHILWTLQIPHIHQMQISIFLFPLLLLTAGQKFYQLDY